MIREDDLLISNLHEKQGLFHSNSLNVAVLFYLFDW